MNVRLHSYLQHPAAQNAERRYSSTAALGELQAERRKLDSLQAADGGAFDTNPTVGAIDVVSPGHGMSVPGRVQASWQGNSRSGSLTREEDLFLDVAGRRTLKTLTETHFTPFGMSLSSATEGPDGVRVRRVETDTSEPSLCYTETYFIARES